MILLRGVHKRIGEGGGGGGLMPSESGIIHTFSTQEKRKRLLGEKPLVGWSEGNSSVMCDAHAYSHGRTSVEITKTLKSSAREEGAVPSTRLATEIKSNFESEHEEKQQELGLYVLLALLLLLLPAIDCTGEHLIAVNNVAILCYPLAAGTPE